jgi:hypothetical protein
VRDRNRGSYKTSKNDYVSNKPFSIDVKGGEVADTGRIADTRRIEDGGSITELNEGFHQ